MKTKIWAFFAAMLLMVLISTASAVVMWNEDNALGTYTRAQAYVSGDWYYPPGELRDAYAHVKGTVRYALPDEGLVIRFRFLYDGYDSGDMYFFPDVDEPGEWAKIYIRPGTVTYIISVGRVGYGHWQGEVFYYVWDTREVSAFIPFD